MVKQQPTTQPRKQFRGILGDAVLAIWSNIDPKDENEFNEWYTHEHLPERVGIPGFLRGRRYAAPSGIFNQQYNYFTLYETESLDVLSSQEYMKRLNNPTDWTRKMVPLFKNSNRTACRVTASLGQGIGGHAATLEMGPTENNETMLRNWLTSEELPEALKHPKLISIHLCEADVRTTQAKDQTEESRAVGVRGPLARWFLLIESSDKEGIDIAETRLCGDERLREHGAAGDFTFNRYQLMVSLSG